MHFKNGQAALDVEIKNDDSAKSGSIYIQIVFFLQENMTSVVQFDYSSKK